jgi:RimJ/RimL family protein N-acetyltransferase
MAHDGFSPVVTSRLLLRAPRDSDAEVIFQRYASDPEVLRYVGWPRHTVVEHTRQFLQFSQAEWQRWPVGPLLIEDRVSGELIGSTGLGFETPYRAATGYVLARDKWGMGFASEALTAVVELARQHRVARLYALCHAEHDLSRRVLDRNGFTLEGILRKHSVFPNLATAEPQDVCCYSKTK